MTEMRNVVFLCIACRAEPAPIFLQRRPSGAGSAELALDNPTFAARQFLYMIIALPQRRAMGFGAPMTSAELDAWARDVVNLFLNGCRGWVSAKK
jgi:hypothetical protein